MPLKLKTVEIDGKKYAELEGDHPAYTNDSGKVIGFDANHATDKITSLNGEAMGHREKFEEATSKLKAFEGIEDPKAAKKALETVAALGDKELIDAGKVDEIKAAAIKATKEQMEAALLAKDDEIKNVMGERDGLANSLNKELIGGNFGRSKFIQEKLTLTPSIAEATFQNHFKVEEGKIVGINPKDGSKIYSPSKPGELASFDEALETIVTNHPDRDYILRGRQQQGGGSHGEGGGGGGKGTIPRSQFDQMSQAERRSAMKEGAKVVD